MIEEFQGEWRWLSNFAPVDIKMDGKIYPSVEHAYMSAKSFDPDWKRICQMTVNPGDVKKASRKIKLRSDWEKIKLDVMWDCIDQKFDQEPYKSKLLATGNVYIQEGNRWRDRFWGFDLNEGVGLNHLGKLIMDKRSRLINS